MDDEHQALQVSSSTVIGHNPNDVRDLAITAFDYHRPVRFTSDQTRTISIIRTLPSTFPN